MPSWSRVATRLRVPVSFIFAAVYLWIARPTWTFIIAGSGVALAGSPQPLHSISTEAPLPCGHLARGPRWLTL